MLRSVADGEAMNKCVWAPAVALLLISSPTAVSAANPDNLLTGYSLTSWYDGDGHPLGSVYAMAQDQEGYLWIGTDSGLFRFDGSQFTSFDIVNKTPSPIAVRALCFTRDGRLLAGLGSGGGVRELQDGALKDPTWPGLAHVDAVTELV